MSSESRSPLRLDDRLQAADLLYAELFHARDRGLMRKALLVAVGIHVAALFVRCPAVEPTRVPPRGPALVPVSRYVPPPRIERVQAWVQHKLAKKVPIPDPTPEAPEPIREPEPAFLEAFTPLPPDAEVLIGVPEAPPPSGPLLAGVGDVANPVLIEASRVQPEYPELARVARVEGHVILQVLIEPDGSVGDVEVLRCNRPNLGFEESAARAVRRWRYEPALQNGKPVAVYLTVFVEFKRH